MNSEKGMEAVALSCSSSFQSSLYARQKKKTVYVRVVNDHHEIELYAFLVFNAGTGSGSGSRDENNKKERPRSRSLRLRRTHDIPTTRPFNVEKKEENVNSIMSRCGVGGSTIYYVGGELSVPIFHEEHKLDRVRCLDTSLRQPEPKSSWEYAAPMLNPRSSPQVVSLDGNIYVMGGTNGSSTGSETWGEVFYPQLSIWKPFPPPFPEPNHYSMYSMAALDQKEFLVGSTYDNFICRYKVEEQLWEHFDIDDNKFPTQFRPIVLGTTLFWFHVGQLCAYNFIRNWYSTGVIKGLNKVIPPECFQPPYTGVPLFLQVAENELLFIFLELIDRNVSILHCIRICVSKDVVQGRRKGPLNAVVQSSESFIIKKPMLILDAVLMDEGDPSSKEE